MKRIFTSFFFLFLFVVANAQWSTTSFRGKKYREDVNVKHHFSLDISLLRSQLANAQEMGSNSRPVIISLPTVSGKIEKFAVYSFPVVAKEIADRYQLGSYVGTGVDDPSKYLRFSLAPNDFQSMIIGDGQSEFIEPVNTDKTVYGVFPKTVKGKDGYRFNCSTDEGSAAKTQMDQLFKKAKSFAKNSGNFARSSDKKYRTLRIAISTTAEYTTFFGGTAGALTQVNATLTRVNGVFEKDLALHMNLQNYPTLIYTNAASDPYDTVTNAWSPPNSWNASLQNTLTSVVGNANYDIGHLFGASGGGGNAGCIGCICVNPTSSALGKGAGITSPATGTVNASATAPPSGDTFDIDYVAHEIGHQLGANHTFSHDIQGTPAHMEPGSGSTIMGYAGITGNLTDVQNNSDPYYHAASIIQIENNLQTKTCDVETAVANNPPVIAPFQDYTIPKGTAFVLTASATDPENNPMTYTWEEFDNASVPIDRNNLGTTTTGASFRSKLPTTNPTRYFPSLPQVMSGVLNNANNTWESVSNVARSTAYVVTVRDNSPAANQQQTDYDGLEVTVHNNGPFIVTTNNVYYNGPSNITWNVVGTNAAPFNATNVKIDYTTNNGTTWTVITNSTPNDGAESINIPGLTNGATIKIRISAIGNIFYAVGTATVIASPACSSSPTTGLTFSNITTTTAVATWDISTGATYSIQYRPQGTTAWTTVTSATNSVILSGLSSGIVYDVQVANVCGGVPGTYSTIGNFITATVNACAITTPGATPGYISEVTITATNANTMTSLSGVPTNPYTDYTTDYSRLVTLVRGSTGNQIRVAKVMTPTTSTFAVAAWIDYNRNGIFEASERILNNGASTTTPITATFAAAVPLTAHPGPETVVMRVIMSRTAITTTTPPCGVLTTNGEIEDYPVRFVDLPACSTTTPPANVLVQNVTASTAQVSWWGSASATYSVQYRPITSPASAWTTATPNPATATSYLITGLADNTQYEVQVANVCAGVTGVYSTPNVFTTPVLSYCSSTSVANTGYISRVRVAPTNSFIMDNPTGPANYTLYNNPIVFYRGNAVNYQVEKDWTTTTQTPLATNIWIDWNRNGIFETSERIINNAANTTNINQSVLTPTNAYAHPTLKTRMRVMVSDVATADPCFNPAIGEVEDYDVTILDMPACTTAAPSNITVTGVTPVAATVSWSGSTGATYQISYNPGPTGGWSTPVAATNPYTITGLTEGTSYQVRVTTICGTVTGTPSTPVPFTTPTVSYCSATSNAAQSGYISKVTVTPNQTTPAGAPEMMNASVQNNYTLYSAPAQRVYLVRGSAGNIMKVNRQWFGAATNLATSVWIDFNRDGIFDVSERVLNNGLSTTELIQQTFTVPAANSANMYMGTQTVRMRVIVRDLASPPACGTFDNGEVEDYEVQLITAPTACSTAAPSNITVTNVTHNSATVSWSSTPGATYDIRWSTSPTGPWLPAAGFASTTNNTYNITTPNALNEQTTYYVQVRSKCSASTGAWSSNVSFTTTEPQYCYAYGGQDTDYIGKVLVDPAGITLPTMSNISGADNYISYVNDPTKLITLEYGTNGNIIEVSKAWNGAVATDAVAVWIDFNRNGTFENTTAERILNLGATSTTPVSNNNFAVPNPPTAAYQGPYNTTMRVVLRKGTAITSPCGSFNNGEVEDYAVRLKPCSTAMPTNVALNNITHTSVVISWTEPVPGSSFMVEYRPTGSGPWIQVPATSNPFTLTGLNPAVSYEVRIAGTCGATFGTYTTPIVFATRCDPSPVQVTVINVTPYSAQANWPAVGSATYTIEIREVGSTGTWTQLATGLTTNSYNINNLDPYTTYEVRVATTCVGETSLNPFSNPVVFTTERTCEIPPPGLTIITLTATTAEVTWDPFPGATYVLRYRKVGLSSWTTINVSTNTHTLTGLAELTRYEMQVANVCNGAVQNFTEPYYFTTPTVNYCPMESSTANNFISNVSVYPTNKPQMINASAASTYTNYTGNPLTFIELEQGSTGNRISIGKSITGNSTVGVAVWIDFNRNGQFDIDEKILSSGPDATGTSEAIFSVPNDAFISMSTYTYVTMRVALSKDGVPVSCMSFPDGEVEDYTVRISKKGIENTVEQTEILIYPNPVSSVLNIKNISKRAKYKIYNAAGQLVGDGTVLNNQINVSKLISGVYVIDINDEINNVTAQRKFIKE